MPPVSLYTPPYKATWQPYTPVLDGSGGTQPVLGTTGQVLSGIYSVDALGMVDFNIYSKVGTAGFVLGNGLWRYSLPSTPILDINNLNAGQYMVGQCICNDASEVTGLGTWAHRLGDVAQDANNARVVAAFDAVVQKRTGSASVAISTSSLAVNHGLGVTPARVFITPTGDWGTSGMGRFWVSAKGATQFTINAVTSAGAALTAAQTFDWTADYEAPLSYLGQDGPIPFAAGDTIRLWGRYKQA